MKTRKTRIIALTLALIMALTLAACGGNTTPPANSNPTNTPAGSTPSGGDTNTPDSGNTDAPSSNAHDAPLYLPESFGTIDHPSHLYALTDNYVAYMYKLTILYPSPLIGPMGETEPQMPDEITSGYVVYFFDDNDFGFEAPIGVDYQYGGHTMPAVFAKKSFASVDKAADLYSRMGDGWDEKYFSLADNVIYATGVMSSVLEYVSTAELGLVDFQDYSERTKDEFLNILTSKLEQDINEHISLNRGWSGGGEVYDTQRLQGLFEYEIYVSKP